MGFPHSSRWTREPLLRKGLTVSSAITTEQKAIRLLEALERAGRSVSSVVVEGRRIEVKFVGELAVDEFERIEMRHDKA